MMLGAEVGAEAPAPSSQIHSGKPRNPRTFLSTSVRAVASNSHMVVCCGASLSSSIQSPNPQTDGVDLGGPRICARWSVTCAISPRTGQTLRIT